MITTLSTLPPLQSGGRKTAIATVKLVSGPGTTIFVNGKLLEDYFQKNPVYLQILATPYGFEKNTINCHAFVTVKGGGLRAQADAVRLALCKALIHVFPTSKSYFKKKNFLTRDARIKERRKYGLKKARKASQYSKR